MVKKRWKKRGRSIDLLFILSSVFVLFLALFLLTSTKQEKKHDVRQVPIPISSEKKTEPLSADLWKDKKSVMESQSEPAFGSASSGDIVTHSNFDREKEINTEIKAEAEGENRDEGEPLPVIAIVIDDFGFSYSLAEKIAAIELPVTWAIIPYQRFTHETARLAASKNIPYLVHMPMEALADKSQGASLIGVGMSAPALSKVVRDVFALLPGAVGMNNHRGSKATSDKKTMEALMETLRPLEKVFVDSRTSSCSVAYDMALCYGIPAVYNSVFLDHEKDIEFMRKQFQRAITIAKRRGWVLAICHNRPDTIPFLQELCDSNINVVKFVTVPELLEEEKGTMRRP